MKPLLEVLREVSLDPSERAAFTADPAHYLDQHGYGGVPVEHLGDAFDLMHDTLPAETAHQLAAHPVLDVPSPDDPLAGHGAGEHAVVDGHAVEGHAAEVGDIAPFGEVTSDFDTPDDHGHGQGHTGDHHDADPDHHADGHHPGSDADHGLSHPGGDTGHDLRTHDLHALRDLGPHDDSFNDVDTGFGHGDRPAPTIGDGYHFDPLGTHDADADTGFGHGVAGHHPGEAADHGLHTGSDAAHHDVGAGFGADLHGHDAPDAHAPHDTGPGHFDAHDLGSTEAGDHGLHASDLHGSDLHGGDLHGHDLHPDLHAGDDPAHGHHGHDALHDVHDIGLF